MGFESIQSLLSEGDDPESVRRLSVGPKLTTDQHPAHVQDLRLAVNVAPF
jgi:hypothetical protein